MGICDIIGKVNDYSSSGIFINILCVYIPIHMVWIGK